MTETDLTILYDYSEQDFDAFQNYFLLTAPYNRKRVRIWQLVGLVASALPLVAGVWLLIVIRQDDALGWRLAAYCAILYGLAYGCYSIIWMPASIRKASLRRMKKVRRKLGYNDHFGKVSIAIKEDSLFQAHLIASSEIAIKHMLDPVLTATHCFFLIDAARAFVVPRNRIESGNLDEFIARFREIRSRT